MKPRRLTILIILLALIGLALAFHGYLATGGFGLWTSGSLTCFFTAHLLSLPHNSGRFLTAFIALGLFAIGAAQFAAYFDFAGFHRTNSLPIVLALGIPLLYVMTGILILLLSLHSSVCGYFDSIEPPHPHSDRKNQQSE